MFGIQLRVTLKGSAHTELLHTRYTVCEKLGPVMAKCKSLHTSMTKLSIFANISLGSLVLSIHWKFKLCIR